jgi:hypothetical protein
MKITIASLPRGARAGAGAGIVACVIVGTATLRSDDAVTQKQRFHLACSTLPFETIKKARDIDDHCDVPGDADPNTEAPHAAQNTAKNNFCAGGAAVPVTNFTFRRLQQIVDQRADIECCGQTLPSNRALLRDLHTTIHNRCAHERCREHQVSVGRDDGLQRASAPAKLRAVVTSPTSGSIQQQLLQLHANRDLSAVLADRSLEIRNGCRPPPTRANVGPN